MRKLFATLCLALALAGCRGTGSGMFGQVTIPPPSTQPPGALLADNSYYQGAASPPASSPFSSPLAAAPSPAPNPISQPGSLPTGISPTPERRGASLARADLGTPARSLATTSREEPIRIPDESASAGTLAAVVPIHGIPKTDATSLFDTIRSQISPSQGFLAARSAPASGFVEISQLPNPPAELRRAALSGRSLR